MEAVSGVLFVAAADCASKLPNVKIIGTERLHSVVADLAAQDTYRLQPLTVVMATAVGVVVKSFVDAPAVTPGVDA